MRRYVIAGGAMLVAAFPLGLLFGQDGEKKKGPNLGELKTKADQNTPVMDNLVLAGRLTHWGRETKNPAALAMASIILSGQPTKELPAEFRKSEQGPWGDSDRKDAGPCTPESLQKEAMELCEGETEQAAVRNLEVFRGASRGRDPCPGIADEIIAPNSTNTFLIPFRGGELAAIDVIGAGYTDLDLYVYDENGNLITSDSGATDCCTARWEPIWTGPFRVEVKNLGSRYNRFRLATN